MFNIAETFRAKGIPCDGIHIDVDYADRYKTFTYNPDAFPEVYELFEVLSGKVRRCDPALQQCMLDACAARLLCVWWGALHADGFKFVWKPHWQE